jgi:PAS domain S-box-containing protein
MQIPNTLILNVNDNEASRYALTRVLRRGGFDVLEARTGAEALALLEREPDLVLLDVHLPDIHGFEVSRLIRERAQPRWVPIIHISSVFVEDSHVQGGLESGADAYLVQPIDPAVLVATLRAFLRASRERGARAEAEARSGALQSQQQVLESAYRSEQHVGEQLRRLAAASLEISKCLDLPRTLEAVNEQARQIIGAHQAISSLTQGEDAHQEIAAVSLSDRYAAWRSYDAPPDGTGIYSLVLRENRPLRLTQTELEAHPAWRGFSTEAGKHPPMRGWLAVPLVDSAGKNLGIIQLSDKYDGEFTDADEAILVQLARFSSAAIENARLYAQVQQELADRTRAEALREGRNQVLELIATSQPLPTVLQALTQLVESQFPRLLCSVLLLDEEQRSLRHGAEDSLPESYHQAVDGTRIGPQVGSCGTAAYLGRTVRVTDIETDPLWGEYRHLALPHGLHACWSTPVCSAQNEVLGTFALYLREVGEITAEEEQLVLGLVPLAGIAISRERETAALRASETRNRGLLDTANEGVWTVDPEGKITYANRQIAELLGARAEDLPGQDFRTFVFPEDRARVDEIQRERRQGIRAQFDFRFRCQDGAAVWCIVSSSPIRDANGEFAGTLGMLTDVTDRRRVEEERDRFFAFSRDLLCIAGLDGVFRRVNPAFVQTLGYSEEELLSRPFLEFVHPDDRDATVRELSALNAGVPTLYFENRYRCKDGTYRWLAWSSAPFTQEGVTYAVARDVTPLKEAEEILEHTRQQLAQSQKMEAVGRLAGGVAHDFNNMLAVINGYSDLALARDDLDPSLYEALSEIKRAGERAAVLTAQLLAFSRKSMISTQVLDVSELVTGMEGMLSRLIGEDIELQRELLPGTGAVKANRGQLEQVLMNLVVNARDAMPTWGRILLRAEPVLLDADAVGEHLPLQPGEYVQVSVSDTGCGMGPDTLEHIWEPFYSTKGNQGTGLGLSTVYGIIQQSGGVIHAQSTPGEGSTFSFLLPRVSAEPEPTQPEPAAPDPPQSSATILLVEDEELVRGLVRSVLQIGGYILLEAVNGDDALALSAAHPGPIHLLLTDVVMPGGMGGRLLAERLLTERPGLKVLYMSGYTDDAVMRHGVEHQETHFIQKPFSPTALLQKVRETLEEAGG